MRAGRHDRLLGLFLAGSAAVHAGALLLTGIPRAPGGQAAAPPAGARLHVALLDPPVHPAGAAVARPGHAGTPAAASAGRDLLPPPRPSPRKRGEGTGGGQRGRSDQNGENCLALGSAPPEGACADGPRLASSPVPAAPPAPAPAPRKRPPAHVAAQPEVVARAGTPGAAPPAPGRSMVATPRPATPGPRLEAALRLRLAEHFRYPPLARRRGWEGTVRLGLRIEPDGRLTRVRVLASSGYGVLDRAAVRALARVGRVPEAAGWLGGRPFDMVLPVEYRLVSR